MPCRHDGLFDRVATFGALHAAAARAIAGKRRKPGAAAFQANLERELLRLEAQLQDGSYRTGRYLELVVRDPKRRVVSAAPFRDRVVHHALVAVIGPLFERGFIDHSYANRVGKGTHRAVARFERLRDHHAHVLRADIWRFFPSIDHAVLKRDLRRRIGCARTLALCDTIIDGSNPQEPAERYFPGDDLFTPASRRRGLPLGNLTSQFFANVHLDAFDHWVTEVLRAPYLRYVDDFALFADSPAQLTEWRQCIERYLCGRRLILHPQKTAVVATAQPQQFLGFELLPGGRRRLLPQNVTRFRSRLDTLRAHWRAGAASADEVRARVGGWVAHATHADTVRLRHTLFKGGWFDPLWADGTSVEAPMP
ncbi:MAG: RNA-dependent DNA polymerase [Proteobacteria bacterium]|nr:RNA-dependent DNA polymerase [Pseudomonadota bacterium]MBS0551493.1 RNA-dependent DNA polymerase [Pseudomonadota bacterium]